MEARNITVFKQRYFKDQRRMPETFRNCKYEIENNVLKIYDIPDYPKDYKKYYPLAAIANFIVNFDEGED